MSSRWKLGAACWGLAWIVIACSSGGTLESAQDGSAESDGAAGGSRGAGDASADGTAGGGGGAGGSGGATADARSGDGSPTTDARTSDASFDAAEACPTLSGNYCWQQLMAEYVAVANCFGHRSKCDRSGTSGDPSQCGKWSDPSQTLCTWPDGSELRRMGPIQVISGPSKTECYKRDYTEVAQGTTFFIFDNRTYYVEQRGATTAVVCPGGSSVEAPSAEVAACGPNGICCSSATPPVCEQFPL